MIDVNVADFVEFCWVSERAQESLVKRVMRQEDYAPYRDYWLVMRSALRRFHSGGGIDSAALIRTAEAANPKKKENYKVVVANFLEGYRLWKPAHGQVLRGEWTHDGVSVRVRPEMTWLLDDRQVAVKLYMRKKTKSMDARVADLFGQLQWEVANRAARGDLEHAVFDAYHRALIECRVPSVDAASRLRAGATRFRELWEKQTGDAA